MTPRLRRGLVPSVAFAFLTTLLLTAASPPPQVQAQEDPGVVVSVEGRGFFQILACVGCVGFGVSLVMQGWPAILAAAATNGSTIAVLSCAGMCAAALTD